MNIGEPIKIHEVNPIAEPIPERVSEEPVAVPVEEPETVEVPA